MSKVHNRRSTPKMPRAAAAAAGTRFVVNGVPHAGPGMEKTKTSITLFP